MQKRLSLLMATTLAIIIAIGAVASPASALERCMPKACCCSKAGGHGTTNSVFASSTSNCHGNSSCCQVQPLMPLPEMAFITTTEAPHSKMVGSIDEAGISTPQTQNPYFTKFNFKAGNLKIPQPPIYLQNQSFLC